MSADDYLNGILRRETVDTGPNSPVREVQQTLDPVLRRWQSYYLIGVWPSGSFAKGTANKSGTDIDLFVSVSEQSTESLKQLYETLYSALQTSGYAPTRQNVSINVRVSGYDVDLVPGKRQNAATQDHSIYRRRADTWTKTNIATHISHVRGYGHLAESRILKLWRSQKRVDFPSFYIELMVIDALRGASPATLAERVWKTLGYISQNIATARVVDPANTNNIISDDLSGPEKALVKAAADRALAAKTGPRS